MKLKLFVILIILLTAQPILACSIFCVAQKGEVLAAGNEDWSDPFSNIWTRPATKNTYGSINFSHSDYQVQTAINEYGLFFDYAAIDKIEGKNNKEKMQYKGDLFSEILAKSKNIDEALIYLNKYQYPSPYHQVLMADAHGKSLIVNQDEIIIKQNQDYQILTNFNATEIKTGNYESPRFQIINNGLSEEKTVTKDTLRSLLSRSHQEAEFPTQYSYIFDLKRGIINLYSFHNYENTVVINIKEELAKGFKIQNLKQLFPTAFEEEYFRTNHANVLKHEILATIKTKGIENGMKHYQDLLLKNPDKVKFPDVLLEVGADLIMKTWMKESQGAPFEYWWHPEKLLKWKPKDKSLNNALVFYKKVEETATGKNPFELIGAYEMIGLINYLQSDMKTAKTYFEKTLVVAPSDSGNYKRAKYILDKLTS